MSPAIKCLIVVCFIAILFITEVIPLAITSVVGAITCGLLGFIPINMVFSGLSNGTIVLFGGMFVVGASMFHTGLAQKIGRSVVEKMGKSENSLMFAIMLISATLSSVLSNTGTVACLMPVVMGICSAAKIPASRQLMPLAYGAGFGGLITMVGSPPNMIAVNALKTAGLKSFTFFEFAWAGIPMTILGILYMMFVGKYFLPKVALDPNAIEIDKSVEEEITASSDDVRKQWYSGLILVVVVVTMMFDSNWFTLEIAAVLGAVAAVLTGCLNEKQAYASIDWITIFLLASMIPVSTALERSGAGTLIASWVVSAMGGTPSPYMVTALLYTVGCVITQFMSNTAAAALLCPIAISIAKQINAEPQAVMMAIVIGASCAFVTPVGTPPNTLILGPGQYKFIDYLKAGWGLLIVGFVVAMGIVPVVWPFFP